MGDSGRATGSRRPAATSSSSTARSKRTARPSFTNATLRSSTHRRMQLSVTAK